MTLGDLTDRQAVLDAIAEYDRVGRERFLEDYGFGSARGYWVLYNGTAYESKALAGAAHKYQLGQPLRSSDFSGGDQTVAARLEALGFTVTRPREVPWITEVGDITTRSWIQAAYGGSSQGGIEPSGTTPNVFIFSDPSSGTEFGYNFDGRDPDEDGVFYQTGDGQYGDQEFTGGNKSIMEAAERGRTLRVFEAVEGKPQRGGKRQRYIGAFHLDAESPYRFERGPDRNGDLRRVIVFRLIGEDGNAGQSDSAARLAPGRERDVTAIPVESSERDAYEVPASAGRVAIRAESNLVERFRSYLEARGSIVDRDKIPIPNESGNLYTDLHDRTTNRLYEAKSVVDRASIRLAIGQLIDYLRFLPETRGFLLLPVQPPSKDLLDLIHSCGFGLVYEHGDEWVERSPD